MRKFINKEIIVILILLFFINLLFTPTKKIYASNNSVAIILSGALVLTFIGIIATSIPQVEEKEKNKMKELLDSWIGLLTYDDALQFFGTPTSQVSGKNVFVAKWSSFQTVGTYSPSYLNNPQLGINYSFPIVKGESLTLIFDKATYILKGYKYEKK